MLNNLRHLKLFLFPKISWESPLEGKLIQFFQCGSDSRDSKQLTHFKLESKKITLNSFYCLNITKVAITYNESICLTR